MGTGVLRNTNWKQVAALGAMLIAIVALWNTMVVYPLKILVVLFHELSHGLAAFATGGAMVRINLSAMQGGTCWSRGGVRFIVLSAGYLGSLTWGGLILLLAARTDRDRLIAGVLGGIILVTGIVFVRPWFSFGWIFSVLGGAALIAAGALLPMPVSDFMLKIIGLTSCLYAPLDILSDLVFRSIPGSDAYELGRITFIPGIVWGVLWWLVAVAGALWFFYLATRRDAGARPADAAPGPKAPPAGP